VTKDNLTKESKKQFFRRPNIIGTAFFRLSQKDIEERRDFNLKGLKLKDRMSFKELMKAILKPKSEE